MEGSNDQEASSSVPLMQDNTKREKEFERKHTIRGQCLDERKKCFCLLIFIILMTLVGITVIIIGSWALVQSKMFFTITTQANILMIILAAIIILLGVLLITVVIGFLLFLRYQRASIRSRRYFCLLLTVLPGLLFLIVAIVYTVTYFTSVIFINKQAVTSAYMSLFTIRDSQEASDAWDTAQKTLKCCGAMYFTDYERVFNNFSVPVSCCNTTNPLANETTCPDIVMNINQTTELIYTEGCVSQIVSIFGYVRIVDTFGYLFASSSLLSFAFIFLFLWCTGCFRMVIMSAPQRYTNADGYNSINDSHQENAENEIL